MESRCLALLAYLNTSAITTKRRVIPSAIGARRGVIGARTILNLEARMAQEIEKTSQTNTSVISQPCGTVAEAVKTLGRFPKLGQDRASTATSLFLGQWPSQKPNDAATYIAGVVALLSEYPAEVVAIVTDPRRGLATRCKFIPTLAEIRESLESEMEPHHQAWRKEQEQRRALPRYDPPKRSQEEIDRVVKLAADTKNKLLADGATQ